MSQRIERKERYKKKNSNPIVDDKEIENTLKSVKGIKYIKKIKKLLRLTDKYEIQIVVRSINSSNVLTESRTVKSNLNIQANNTNINKNSLNIASESEKLTPKEQKDLEDSKEWEVLEIKDSEDSESLALRSRINYEKIKEIKYFEVSKQSFSVLDSKEWIGDEIVNCMVKLLYITPPHLISSENRRYVESSLIVYSYTYNQIQKRINAGMIQEVDNIFIKMIEKYRKKMPMSSIIFPICSDYHWYLVIIRLDKKEIKVYDSYKEGKHDLSKTINVLNEYIKNSLWIREQINELDSPFNSFLLDNGIRWELISKNKDKNSLLTTEKLDFKVVYVECPQQKNEYDWGVYLCFFLLYWYQGLTPPEIQSDTKSKRKALKRCILYADIDEIKGFIVWNANKRIEEDQNWYTFNINKLD